ncbi:MAG: cisplatin damage response ATP-dependent DNA ligase [Pseudomonadota bacterium]
MKAFSVLLDRLVYTPGRNAKIRLLGDYFRATPDPDRGWALAALTDGLPFSFPVRRTLGELIAPRLDAELFRMSRDYVGDTAETVALVWEPRTIDAGATPEPPTLAEIADTLALIDKRQLGQQLEAWLDGLDATGRWALLKLLTGALRVGVSARLAKTALADAFDRNVDDIEEVWHGLSPPYGSLFAWLDGDAPPPDISGAPVFRPMMLANPLEDADWAAIDLSQFSAEWKWDGIRVQVAGAGDDIRLYSRTGDDIGQSFPELLEPFRFEAVLDGELLVVRDGVVAPFNDLQQRLNRKSIGPKLRREYPAHIRFYDALMLDGEDLRGLSFEERRAALEAWHERAAPPATDLSELITAPSKDALAEIREGSRAIGIEGLMLKRRESPYLPGRPKGHWYKWKRAPLTLDCVMMYAQRGSGKRSSFFSDYTFGAWRTDDDGNLGLVPVGKAYSGFTDAELKDLDRFVRNNTIDRFGPVRSVEPKLVLEVEFDSVHRSTRHKSGVAMRFPRIHRIRWDKPADEADRLETLEAMIETVAGETAQAELETARTAASD